MVLVCLAYATAYAIVEYRSISVSVAPAGPASNGWRSLAGRNAGDQLELLARRRRVTPRVPRTYHPHMSNGDLHWIANYIWGPRQRFTLRLTWRVLLMRLSTALVVASERWRRGERPSVSTVTVSSSPSRTLAAAQGCSWSRRRARYRSNRVAVLTSSL